MVHLEALDVVPEKGQNVVLAMFLYALQVNICRRKREGGYTATTF